jgi:hypothetical protein
MLRLDWKSRRSSNFRVGWTSLPDNGKRGIQVPREEGRAGRSLSLQVKDYGCSFNDLDVASDEALSDIAACFACFT